MPFAPEVNGIFLSCYKVRNRENWVTSRHAADLSNAGI